MMLPCPPDAGWELIRRQELPRRAEDGRPLGGFSAVAYERSTDRLWLLSDAPQGHLVPPAVCWRCSAAIRRQGSGRLNSSGCPGLKEARSRRCVLWPAGICFRSGCRPTTGRA